ncbi:MAG TPA: Rrf2 family transcriptional regulator [Candidatus Desulfovibrio intestinipullorum]|uniref:Rrf2 family transcriptional regulator n=1 Tax=Candidatus Desulfovibrio intestinipullorum TaxID=2838536 RepID=A0A9D1TP69_9BACT|nr:Rrf2 family transcriptional regulator [Candidatus Desulfovibrio intestinipullorum]
MHFSTRTRYGLRFLLCLAELPPGERIQLSQVGEKENISSGYLQQIARALRPLNILTAVRGAGGGYGLNRPAEEINLEDIIVHLEGEISPVRCLTDNCPRKDMCTTVSFWQEFDDHMRSFLRSKTLKDLGNCDMSNFLCEDKKNPSQES